MASYLPTILNAALFLFLTLHPNHKIAASPISSKNPQKLKSPSNTPRIHNLPLVPTKAETQPYRKENDAMEQTPAEDRVHLLFPAIVAAKVMGALFYLKSFVKNPLFRLDFDLPAAYMPSPPAYVTPPSTYTTPPSAYVNQPPAEYAPPPPVTYDKPAYNSYRPRPPPSHYYNHDSQETSYNYEDEEDMCEGEMDYYNYEECCYES